MGLMDELNSLLAPKPLNPDALARVHPSYVPMQRAQNYVARQVNQRAPILNPVLDLIRNQHQPLDQETVNQIMGDKSAAEQFAENVIPHEGHETARMLTEMGVDWNPVTGPFTAVDRTMRALNKGDFGSAAKNAYFARFAPDAIELGKQAIDLPGKINDMAAMARRVYSSHPIENFLEKVSEGTMSEGGSTLGYLRDYGLPHAAAIAKAAPMGLIHTIARLAHPVAEAYSVGDEANVRGALGPYGSSAEGEGQGGMPPPDNTTSPPPDDTTSTYGGTAPGDPLAQHYAQGGGGLAGLIYRRRYGGQ
jgi:hypothetical protein